MNKIKWHLLPKQVENRVDLYHDEESHIDEDEDEESHIESNKYYIQLLLELNETYRLNK